MASICVDVSAPSDITRTLTANGFPVDPSTARLGSLDAANDLLDDPPALRAAMAERGHLFFKRLIDPEIVRNARLEVLTKYAVLGEIDDRQPIEDGIVGDGDAVPTANLRAFSTSVRSGYWYRRVTDGPEVLGVMADLLDGEVRVFEMRWPRFVRPGEGCGFHCDGPYMNRGTDRIFSAWVPLGDIVPADGGLIVLENSHRSERLLSGYLQADADRDGLQWLDDDPVNVQERYGDRWLTTDFEMGDVLMFGMHTLHGALDNQSPVGRCRLSSDSRYQRADEPADPRWNGADFEGHGGNRVFYPGLGRWNNDDFQDEWKDIDDQGRIILRLEPDHD